MELIIDTETKTVISENAVNLEELLSFIQKSFTDWREWKVANKKEDWIPNQIYPYWHYPDIYYPHVYPPPTYPKVTVDGTSTGKPNT